MYRKYIYLISFILIVIVILITLLLWKKSKEEGKAQISPAPFIPLKEEMEYDEAYIEEFNQARDKVGYEYTLSSGETITIKIPADVDPPPLETVEKMWRMREE